jgi:hypothetical protein
VAFKAVTLLMTARRLARDNPDAVHNGIDKVAALARQAAPSRHREKVDRGAAGLKRITTGRDGTAGSDRRT